MLRTKKLVAALALILVLCLGFGAMAEAAAPKPTKVRLSEVVRSVFYAPMYVAMTQGLFAKEGIEIELSTAWGADKGAAALMSGTVDIGLFGPEAGIYVYQQGAVNHFVVFAELTACDGSFLVARKPMPNFKWSDVKGKIIVGGRPGGVPEMTLEYVIRQAGLDPFKDVNIIRNLAFTANSGAFESGIGDFVALFEPNASQLEKMGNGYVVSSIGGTAGPQAYTAFHTRKDYLKKHPDVIQRFTNAIYRGQLWVKTHTPDEVVDAIAKFFPDTDRDLLRRCVNRYQKVNAYQDNPILTQEAFNRLQDIMVAAEELKTRAPYAVLVNNTFAKKAMQTIKTP